MDFKDLLVYKKSFYLAMKIFEVSKRFPKEEQYSLTDQIRRSSRSVCSQIAEAYRQRDYPKYFKSKLAIGDGENAETQVWLEFSLTCRYLDNPTFKQLTSLSLEVGRLLNDMIRNPQKYGVRKF